MSELSNAILSKAKVSVSAVPPIYVEKASVSEEGTYAKVLFRVGVAVAGAKVFVKKNLDQVEKAFDAKLQGTARLVTASVVPASEKSDGLFTGYVVLNREKMSHASAMAKGFNLVAANVFADADDNIWAVEDASDGSKILVRTADEDLQELLKTRTMPSTMATAAAGYVLPGAFDIGSIVAFYDAPNECIAKGIAIDRETVYNLKGSFYALENIDVVASTDAIPEIKDELEALYPNKDITFAEASADPDYKRRVVAYLTALYGHNKEFLDAYLTAVDRFLDA